MAESSLPTFDLFCQHHDEASLYADQEYFRQYQEILGMYVSFASKEVSPTIFATSAPIALRWRSLGLKAIKSVVSSEALATLAGKQLDLIVPTLLGNIWSENPDFVNSLEEKAQAEEKLGPGKLSRRRTSISTVHVEEASAEEKAALSGTSADADKIAETDIGVLAIQCLKLVFVVNNKSQIHGATLATIRFIADCIDRKEIGLSVRSQAKNIFKIASSSAPVQDRYTILVTTMESLVQVPLVEENLQQQLVLATLINCLLKSDINLIGLSVMDVLLALIQYILRVIQTSRPPSDDASSSVENQSPQKNTDRIHENSSTSFHSRTKLLKKLQNCIGNLATHVYYSDQISDMITALLSRIKPSPMLGDSLLAAGVENPAPSSVPISTSSVNNSPDDSFFSLDTAKIVALEAIKSVLLVAGSRKGISGGLSRNFVPIQVWEGTQWLLRDTSGRVRKAYVAALITWAHYELTKADLRASEEKFILLSRIPKEDSSTALNKQAIPSTLQREKGNVNSPHSGVFLELLHLAIYENALKYFDCEEDIVLLHLLLSSLVEHMGVNAVKNGLPMIFRLQADISEDKPLLAKIRIGCLCYGYFWTLCDNFQTEISPIKEIIESEIRRRQNLRLWIDKIRCPPISIEEVNSPGQACQSQFQPLVLECIDSEAIKPFDDRIQMVELISSSYEISTALLAISPISSSRTHTQPTVGPPGVNGENTLPEKTKSIMLSEWNREAVIATARERVRTVSLNGSKTGTTATGHRKFLSVGEKERTRSLNGQNNLHIRHRNSSGPSLNNGLVGGLGAVHKLRRSSGHPTPTLSESGHNSVTRIEQLKRVLQGQEIKTHQSNRTPSNNSSESLISYDYTASEISFNASQQNIVLPERLISNREPRKVVRPKSRDNKDQGAGSRIPSASKSSKIHGAAAPQDHLPDQELLQCGAEKKLDLKGQNQGDQLNTLTSLEYFLKNIEIGPERAEKNITKPPYY
ncbi:hypothetical protein K3495_g6318 [Podosphaera aphanis]|nr:hypothetical protein K3495_g6318 [Podosphaera aphanis]